MAEQLTHFDDRFWNRLLKAIEEGHVVPVVGSQLLTWNDQNNMQSLQHCLKRVVLIPGEFWMLRDISVKAAAQATGKLQVVINRITHIQAIKAFTQQVFIHIVKMI